MDRPKLYKRYTSPTPFHLTFDPYTLSSFHDKTPSPNTGSIPERSKSPTSDDMTSLHTLEPLDPFPPAKPSRILRKSSQPGISRPAEKVHSGKKGKGLSISTAPFSSFLSLDEQPKRGTRGNLSTPPLTAGHIDGGFRIDKSRTRKQSLAVPPLPWGVLPSIQGVMQSPKSLDDGSKEIKSILDLGEEKRKNIRKRRETLKLPIMPPPRSSSASTTVSSTKSNSPSSRKNSCSPAQIAHNIGSTSTAPHTQFSNLPTTRQASNDAVYTAVYGSRSCGYENLRPADVNPIDLRDWTIISPHSPPSPPPRGSSFAQSLSPSDIASSHHSSAVSLGSTWSQETELNTEEVLRTFNHHLDQPGWEGQLAEQMARDRLPSPVPSNKVDTGSMRSWRDITRAEKGKKARPLSAQYSPRQGHAPSSPNRLMTSPIVRQHSDSRAYTTIKNAPTVLPRSISRLAQTSEDKTLPIGYHSTVDRFRPAKTSLPPTLSVRRRESRKSKDGVRVPLVLSPSIGLEKEISLANSSNTHLPFHLRPLPPLPSLSNTPPKSSLLQTKFHTRLLRPKRSSAPQLIISNPIPLSANTQPQSPTKVYPRLVPRDEPPAALGKRSSDIADRRRGMTALSFLVHEEPSRDFSSPGSGLSRFIDNNDLVQTTSRPAYTSHRRNTSLGKSSVITRSESPIVNHIIPPEELCKIGLEDRKSASNDEGQRDQIELGGTIGLVAPKSKRASLSINTSLTRFRSPGSILSSADSLDSPPGVIRPNGPVVPPRKLSQPPSNIFTLDSPTHEAKGFTVRSPPPPPRRQKASAPPQGVIYPASNLISNSIESRGAAEASQRALLGPGRSACALPANDRPTTLGNWISPPATPSPKGRTIDLPTEEEAPGQAAEHDEGDDFDVSPIVPDGEFGTPSSTQRKIKTTAKKRYSDEAITPLSAGTQSGSTWRLEDVEGFEGAWATGTAGNIEREDDSGLWGRRIDYSISLKVPEKDIHPFLVPHSPVV